MAPLTLSLYAHYWKKQNAGQEFRLASETPLRRYLEKSIAGCEILSPLKNLLDPADFLQSGLKLIAIFDRFSQRGSGALPRPAHCRYTRLQPEASDFERIERSFPEFLAYDLLAHLKSHGEESLCLAIDTFERMEPGGGRDIVERLSEISVRA